MRSSAEIASGRVVAPAVGVPDLGGEGLQLGQRPLAGLGAHPLEHLEARAVRGHQVADQLDHPLLGLRAGSARRRTARRPPPPGRPPRVRRPRFQRSRSSRGAAEGRAVEVEVRLHHLGVEQGGAAAHHRPCQPVAPRLDRLLGQQCGQRLDVARLPDHHLGDVLHRGAEGLEPVADPDPVDEPGHVGQRHPVVGLQGVAGVHVVPVPVGDRGLQRHDPARRRARSGVVGAPPRQPQHARDVRHVRRRGSRRRTPGGSTTRRAGRGPPA